MYLARPSAFRPKSFIEAVSRRQVFTIGLRLRRKTHIDPDCPVCRYDGRRWWTVVAPQHLAAMVTCQRCRGKLLDLLVLRNS